MSLYDDRAADADAILIAQGATAKRLAPTRDAIAEREAELGCSIRVVAPMPRYGAATLLIRDRGERDDRRDRVPGYTGTSMPSGQGPGEAASIRADQWAIRESIAACHRAERRELAAKVAAAKAAEAQAELALRDSFRRACRAQGLDVRQVESEIALGFTTMADVVRHAMRRAESARYSPMPATLGHFQTVAS